MGEYVKHLDRHVKIGTCESLYYISYDRYLKAFNDKKLSFVDGNLFPLGYLKLDHGFLFRFPFPDEDNLKFGEINGEYDRSVAIKMDAQTYYQFSGNVSHQDFSSIHIVLQKPIIRDSDQQFILAVVVRDSNDSKFYSLRDDETFKILVKSIIRNHVAKELDLAVKKFYRAIAARIVKGYRLSPPAVVLQQQPIQATGSKCKSEQSTSTTPINNPKAKAFNINKKKKGKNKKL